MTQQSQAASSFSTKDSFSASPSSKAGRRSSKSRSSAKENEAGLSCYFREMASHKVMSAANEAIAAQATEEAEVDMWCQLLSFVPAAAHLLNDLEANVQTITEDDRPSMSDIQGLQALLQSSPHGNFSAKQQAEWQEFSASLGKSMRIADSNRAWMNGAIKSAKSMTQAAGSKGTPAKFKESRKYQTYVQAVIDADSKQQACKSRFIRSNLRLVVSIAHRYNRGRIPLNDLIQEGNIGLIKAVERFDHSRGYRFSTYASWWIRHAISRSLADKGRTIRIPVHMLDSHNRVHRAQQEMKARCGREATSAEISKATGIPESKLAKVRDLYTDTPMSLDRPVGDETGCNFVDFLRDDSARAPDEQLASARWSKDVHQHMSVLTPMEFDIIRYRFGFDDVDEMTLKEIGQKHGLSRERIRQLQAQAIGKIRAHMRATDSFEV